MEIQVEMLHLSGSSENPEKIPPSAGSHDGHTSLGKAREGGCVCSDFAAASLLNGFLSVELCKNLLD